MAKRLLFIKYSNGLVYIRPSVRLSVFTISSRTIRRRMMKLATYILEVKSKMKSKDGSRTWPLTPSNWRFYIMHMQRVHVRLHSVHVHRTHSRRILGYMCYRSLFTFLNLEYPQLSKQCNAMEVTQKDKWKWNVLGRDCLRRRRTHSFVQLFLWFMIHLNNL